VSATSFPVTGPDVQEFLGVGPGGSTTHEQAREAAAAAASSWVAEKCLGLDPVDTATWPSTVKATLRLGCVLLAARWYGRRTSTNGVAAFQEMGVAYVMRSDPDVASLLELDRPSVG
jgi:hypothetical protein